MKLLIRGFQSYFGSTAKKVSIRSKRPWYWQVLTIASFIALGYFAAYLQLSGGDVSNLHETKIKLLELNRELQTKLVINERQLQVEKAAQSNLTKEMSALQEEQMKLKEDVVFYKNIIGENKQAAEVQLQSIKFNKTQQSNRYEYHILILQSGRHDRDISGALKLQAVGEQNGQLTKQPILDGQTGQPLMKINFKYYQRLDGFFNLPENFDTNNIEVSFYEQGNVQAKLSQQINLPR